MASKKFAKGSDEWMMFMDFWNLCQKFWISEDTDEYYEQLIKENNFFGLKNGYKIRNPNNPESESSATIVWNCLDKLNVKPLIWNAFPFHPHNECETNSNRAPTSEELKVGKIILEELIEIFNIEQNHIIPVGRNAEKNLKGYKIVTCLRHPSHGGKYEFIKGMERIFNVTLSQDYL